LKQRVIIGAVVLVGLLLPILALRQAAPSAKSGMSGVADPGSPEAQAEQERARKAKDPASAEAQSAAADDRARLLALELGVNDDKHGAYGGGAAGGPAHAGRPRFRTDPQGLGMAIVGVTPALRDCYEGYGRLSKEKLPKKVQVNITVAADPNDPSHGIVTNAATSDQKFQHQAVEDCLKQAVSNLNFEPPANPIEAHLPVALARK
jgi:hypothetical protein